MKTFVLDTNVILYDPNCLKVFADNEVVIPLPVLDELDGAKSRFDDVGRNARLSIRMLDELRGSGSLSKGVKLNDSTIRVELNHCGNLPSGLSAEKADNRIISSALGLKNEGKHVIVVSKDINLRVKCDAVGLEAQDYTTGKIAEQVSSIYSGIETLTVPSSTIDKIYSDGFIEAEFSAHPNQFFILNAEDKNKQSGVVKFVKGKGSLPDKLVPLKKINDVMNIRPRNVEQKIAMDLLLDNNIKLVTMIGKAGSGKAQPLDADVLTPNGYIKMGQIKIGNEISTPDGGVAKVSGIFPQGLIDIYKVYFSDGTFTECSEDHLWMTRTQLNRDQKKNGSVKSLKEIMNSLRYGKINKRNHSIPITKPIEFSDKNITVDPYLLGLLIGDGSLGTKWRVSISSADPEILNYCAYVDPRFTIHKTFRKYDYNFIRTGDKPFKTKNPIVGQIKDLKLNIKSNDKFIPLNYKYSSIKTRLALLQGLMDTDGTTSNHSTSYCSISLKLAEDVKFIVESLGGTAKITHKIPKYTYKGIKKIGQTAYRVWIVLPPDIIPFRLKRKIEKYIVPSKYFPRRYIDKVEYVGKKEAQCIYVEHPDHLYITNNFIVTHNTLCACAAALHHVLTDCKTYDRVLISRPVQPMGRDIGFLPGTIEEKLNPWMQPIYDNLEFILGSDFRNSSLYEGIIQVEPLTYIRGRSIPRSFIILDEAQNLSAQEIKTIITRVGENTKIIITGDISQIDAPHLDFADNGLTHVVEKFKDYEISGHITFKKGERSELATLASEIL